MVLRLNLVLNSILFKRLCLTSLGVFAMLPLSVNPLFCKKRVFVSQSICPSGAVIRDGNLSTAFTFQFSLPLFSFEIHYIRKISAYLFQEVQHNRIDQIDIVSIVEDFIMFVKKQGRRHL
jgi:hypothetical protein